jgi:hypothetical protein
LKCTNHFSWSNHSYLNLLCTGYIRTS